MMIRRKLPLTHWFYLRYTYLGQREELRSDPPVQYLYNRSHGHNLRSTSGQAEPYCAFFLLKVRQHAFSIVVRFVGSYISVYFIFFICTWLSKNLIRGKNQQNQQNQNHSALRSKGICVTFTNTGQKSLGNRIPAIILK